LAVSRLKILKPVPFSLLVSMMNTSEIFKFRVESDEAGQRLDSYIAGRLADCSRSHAAVLIRQGFIRVDNQNCKPGYRVKSNEHILAQIPAPAPTKIVGESLPLNIIFEDQDLMVINKPAGMVVHPAAGHSTGTLVHGILYHCPDLEGIGGEKRPGIVHRLDKDTSGIMVVAKNAFTHHDLARQFKDRSIQKRYLALVIGSPQTAAGQIDLPVGRHPVERKKMSTHGSRGRDALTLWKVQERLPGAALLEIELKTGRTHQIRVHCQAMGYPIVGDPVYTQRGALKSLAHGNPALHQALKKAQRQMLHAWSLGFRHPADSRPLLFEVPIPEDMAAILNELRRMSKMTDLC
jgi:23S rRNA pseudouridine1911/1915/1917 synthase